MTAERSQEDYFRSTGGDQYFTRNVAVQSEPRRNHPAFRLLEQLPQGSLNPQGRAAVLGGAGGREAAALAEILPGYSVANVDISQRAIESGRAVFPLLEHHCLSLTSSDPGLSIVLGEQDIIFAVAVLHWIDRQHLARGIANIDESLRDGGYLLIADFFPSTNRKNPIRHSPEHFTYKQDYSASFLALGTYEVVASNTRVAPTPAQIPAQERRVADVLLRKNLTGLYPIGWTD